MEPISNVDRLVLLLRQRLDERARVAPGRAASAANIRRNDPPAIQALAAVEGVDDRHLRRALIQNLLSESFGEKIINEAGFQQVVNRVTQTIEADVETARLLDRLVRDLKAAAR